MWLILVGMQFVLYRSWRNAISTC